MLIRDGAIMVTGIEDIIEALGAIGSTIREHVGKESMAAENRIHTNLFDIADLNLTDDENKII